MAESQSEIVGAICLAVSVFAASLVPWLLLVDSEHLTPAWLRAAVLVAYVHLVLTAAAVLFLFSLSAPKGAVR